MAWILVDRLMYPGFHALRGNTPRGHRRAPDQAGEPGRDRALVTIQHVQARDLAGGEQAGLGVLAADRRRPALVT
jgi:hypothetical protein